MLNGNISTPLVQSLSSCVLLSGDRTSMTTITVTDYSLAHKHPPLFVLHNSNYKHAVRHPSDPRPTQRSAKRFAQSTPLPERGLTRNKSGFSDRQSFGGLGCDYRHHLLDRHFTNVVGIEGLA